MTDNDIFSFIEKRARYINSSPFKRESLRFSQIMETMAALAREASLMSGGTGFDDLLLNVAGQAVAWVKARRDSHQFQLDRSMSE